MTTRPANCYKALDYSPSVGIVDFLTAASNRTIIRPSLDADIPAITAIYAHHVLNSTSTFENEAPSTQDMTNRLADVVGKINASGWKFDAWRDIVVAQKTLGLGDTRPFGGMPR